MMNSFVDSEEKTTCRSVWLRRQRAKMKHYRPRVSSTARKDRPSQQGHVSEIAEIIELDKLPEDILHHIHALVPLRDAARAACVSHRFLRSWRHFPNLAFNWETFGLNYTGTIDERAKRLADGIHHILGNHSGNGVKTLKIPVHDCGDFVTANRLELWLQAAVKSGIVELDLDPPRDHGPKYKFPCSLLSRAASSLQTLSLSYCVFQPTLRLGSFINLKSVCLVLVHITELELDCLFSCAISLEKFEISQCDGITFLKIPSHLQLFSMLRVFLCRRLQSIEICAPKIITFLFSGPPMKISIRDSSQLKSITMNGFGYCGMFQYALAKLHSIASNLQDLTLLSSGEALNMPTLPGKFLHLRHLKIRCSGIRFRSFDFLCLVSFLEACPVLESFVLLAGQSFIAMQDPSILKDPNANPLDLRRIPEFHHDALKKVTITGFCSSKSLIELTRQILGNCSSLECLVLDTTTGYNNTGRCPSMDTKAVKKALEGVEAIERYVKGNVPSTVNLEVLEPCCKCHISKL